MTKKAKPGHELLKLLTPASGPELDELLTEIIGEADSVEPLTSEKPLFFRAAETRAAAQGMTVDQLLADYSTRVKESKYPTLDCLFPDEVQRVSEGETPSDEQREHVLSCEPCRSLLDAARISDDRRKELMNDVRTTADIQVKEVRPAEIADDVCLAFEEPAARKRITLEIHAQDRPAVVTDLDRVRRILENLVDNAIKYTPEGGRVEVRALAAAGGGARVEVRDDGPGIPPEHLARLSERFYRVEKARSREMDGTGLGLAIVKQLAQSIGASVSVESEVDKGTCFALVLPAAPPKD